MNYEWGAHGDFFTLLQPPQFPERNMSGKPKLTSFPKSPLNAATREWSERIPLKSHRLSDEGFIPRSLMTWDERTSSREIVRWGALLLDTFLGQARKGSIHLCAQRSNCHSWTGKDGPNSVWSIKFLYLIHFHLLWWAKNHKTISSTFNVLLLKLWTFHFEL